MIQKKNEKKEEVLSKTIRKTVFLFLFLFSFYFLLYTFHFSFWHMDLGISKISMLLLAAPRTDLLQSINWHLILLIPSNAEISERNQKSKHLPNKENGKKRNIPFYFVIYEFWFCFVSMLLLSDSSFTIPHRFWHHFCIITLENLLPQYTLLVLQPVDLTHIRAHNETETEFVWKKSCVFRTSRTIFFCLST